MFRNWAETLWNFLRNVFSKFSITQFVVSRGSNWRKRLFLDNSHFHYFFRTLSNKVMWLFAKWFSEGLSEVPSTRPAEIFEAQILWPTKIMWIVWDFKRKGFGRWSKLPSTVTCNVNFSRKKCVFWWRFNFWTFLYFEWNVSGRVVRTRLYVSRGTFRGNFYIQESFRPLF